MTTRRSFFKTLGFGVATLATSAVSLTNDTKQMLRANEKAERPFIVNRVTNSRGLNPFSPSGFNIAETNIQYGSSYDHPYN